MGKGDLKSLATLLPRMAGPPPITPPTQRHVHCRAVKLPRPLIDAQRVSRRYWAGLHLRRKHKYKKPSCKPGRRKHKRKHNLLLVLALMFASLCRPNRDKVSISTTKYKLSAEYLLGLRHLEFKIVAAKFLILFYCVCDLMLMLITRLNNLVLLLMLASYV